MQRLAKLGLFVVVAVMLFTPAGGASAQDSKAFGDFDMIVNARPPMRDGVELSARVWRPTGTGRFPTVLVMTPYIADEQHDRAKKFVKAGYAYVTVDTRGMAGSGGDATPLEGAGPDGCDTIDWIRKQPWSDGRVVMRGGSYRGMVQWQIAAKCADKLLAMVPTAPVYPGEDFPALAGAISYPYAAQWLAFTSDRVSNPLAFQDEAYWQSISRRHARGQLAFADIDDAIGLKSDFFDLWNAEYGKGGARWRNDNPTPAEMARITIPVLSITGYFDGDQLGTLRYYREHFAAAPAAARANHLLVMGPWSHAGTRYPTRKLDGLDVGEAAVVDLDGLQIAYFDWILKRGPRPALLKDQVVVYDLGQGSWRSAPTLAAAGAPPQRYYLTRANGDGGVFAPGALDTVARQAKPTVYRIDPLAEAVDPVSDPLVNPRAAYRPQARVFQTAPFDTAMMYSGRFTADLAMAMDTRDADIGISVYAISPDGASVQLGYDVIRARYRNGPEQLMTPGQVERIKSMRAYWNSMRLEKGTRIRLVIGPVEDLDWHRNFNSGGDLLHETAKDAKVATVSIHHDLGAPSTIDLPVSPLN